jgi:hypothetical protein
MVLDRFGIGTRMYVVDDDGDPPCHPLFRISIEHRRPGHCRVLARRLLAWLVDGHVASGREDADLPGPLRRAAGASTASLDDPRP